MPGMLPWRDYDVACAASHPELGDRTWDVTIRPAFSGSAFWSVWLAWAHDYDAHASDGDVFGWQ